MACIKHFIKTSGQTSLYTLLKVDFKGAGRVAMGSKSSVKFSSPPSQTELPPEDGYCLDSVQS